MSATVASQHQYPDVVSPATSALNHCGGQRQGNSYNSDDEDSSLESLLTELPQHAIPSFFEDRLHHMSEGIKESGWQQSLKAVAKHDADLCQAYREQIDTLLVFAGLFSAVVTAFAVESYQWLLEDPADTSVDLLRDVVHLLAQSLNQTALPVRPTGPRLSDGTATRINVLWFLSLSISLSAALVGILCKQWLREFERDVGQAPETDLGVRHIRYQGLSYWKVGDVVNSVPVLLQFSLALFLTGILELLWRVNLTVAICVTAIACITLAFYMATTLLPLLQYTYIILRLCGQPSPQIETYAMDVAFTEPQCAFKSAQAWIALRAIQPAVEYLTERYCYSFRPHRDDRSPLELRPVDSWISFDINWMRRRDHIHWGPKSAYEALGWIAENLDEKHLSSSIWQCVWARWLQTRHDRRDLVHAVLDLGCVARAFPEPIHLDIDTAASIRVQALVFRCSLRTTLSIDTAIELILRISPEIGVDSRWTAEAVRTVCLVYRNTPIRLSNDVSVGLFRLAKSQTQAIIRRQSNASVVESSSAHWQGTAAFFEVFLILLDAHTEYRERLMPAMCALALQWLRAYPGRISTGEFRTSNANFAVGIAQRMITYYASLKCDPSRLHEYPGVIFPARLTAMVVSLSPEFGQPATEYWWSILQTLLHIARANLVTIADSTSRTPPALRVIRAPPMPTVPEDNEEPSSPKPADYNGSRAPSGDGNGDHSLPESAQHIVTQLDANVAGADLNHAASPRESPISSEP